MRPISAGFSADFNRTPFKLGRQLSRGCPPVVLMKRNRSGQADCPLCLVLSNCPGLRLAGHSHQVAAEGPELGREKVPERAARARWRERLGRQVCGKAARPLPGLLSSQKRGARIPDAVSGASGFVHDPF